MCFINFFDLLLVAKMFFYFFGLLHDGFLEGVCELTKFHCVNRTKPKLAMQKIKPEENKGHMSIQRKELTAAIFPS